MHYGDKVLATIHYYKIFKVREDRSMRRNHCLKCSHTETEWKTFFFFFSPEIEKKAQTSMLETFTS